GQVLACPGRLATDACREGGGSSRDLNRGRVTWQASILLFSSRAQIIKKMRKSSPDQVLVITL
ncbi:MAG TPA: hypothetical protein PKD05_20265, partial [Candidatus Melainabacteria bacterium]|nr:hypothetical protein [Candidatus Melainabacteria bacterium]